MKTIKARDVKVGDYIWNASATHPAFRWCRVNTVEKGQVAVVLEGNVSKHVPGVLLHTSAFTTIKILDEAVAIR